MTKFEIFPNKEMEFNRTAFLKYYLIYTISYIVLFYATRELELALSIKFDVTVVIFGSILELIYIIFISYFTTLRLNNIGWPKWLSIIFIIYWLLSMKNIVIFDVLFNDGNGFEGLWLLWVPTITSYMVLALLFFVLVMPPEKLENEIKS